MRLTGKKVAVVRGGPGPEKEISCKSAQAVARALKQLRLSFFFAEADINLPEALKKEKPDLAFLGTHGMYGEDGCPQAVCELLRIPYTGSGILASALCMDKIFFKKWLQKNKIARAGLSGNSRGPKDLQNRGGHFRIPHCGKGFPWRLHFGNKNRSKGF